MTDTVASSVTEDGEPELKAEILIRLTRVRELLDITSKQLRDILDEASIQFQKTPGTGQRAVTQNQYRQIERIVAYSRPSTSTRRLPDNALQVRVTDPSERVSKSATATLYVGPTNSGKTYHALEALSKSWNAHKNLRHAYAAPLRLLAYEVYQKLAEEHGQENVGFITGEEQINPEAPILACTVEMTPSEGHMLVLDEAHWLTDPIRGHYWTRHIRDGRWTHQHLLTAAEAVPTLKTLLTHADSLHVRTFERRTPIKFQGTLSLDRLPKKTAVVAFSRKEVYSLALKLKSAGYRPGVLYGRLPLEVRKRQIQKFLKGEYDVMVCTDVIGHGINLPLDNVVFAGATKFDGYTVRNLHIWEAAQIAGRAGRFGYSEQGQVFALAEADFQKEDLALLREAVKAAAGLAPTDLQAGLAVEAPRLDDLLLHPAQGVEHASLLPAKLDAWMEQASQQYPAPYVPAKLHIQHALMTAALIAVGGNPDLTDPKEPCLHAPGGNFTVGDTWQLSRGPFAPGGFTIARIAQWRAASHPETSPILGRYFRDHVLKTISLLSKADPSELQAALDDLEHAGEIASELKMAIVMFGGEDQSLGTLTFTQVEDAERELNELIWTALTSGLPMKKQRFCNTCGKKALLPPKQQDCERCIKQGRARR